MAYEIQKVIDGEIEYLPDIVETQIWPDFEYLDQTRKTRLIAALYRAVAERENYYQFNTPTAFGDPEYRHACGVVTGILQAAEIEEKEKNGKLVFMKGKKTILIVDKIKLHKSYYEAQRENREMLEAFGVRRIM